QLSPKDQTCRMRRSDRTQKTKCLAVERDELRFVRSTAAFMLIEDDAADVQVDPFPTQHGHLAGPAAGEPEKPEYFAEVALGEAEHGPELRGRYRPAWLTGVECQARDGIRANQLDSNAPVEDRGQDLVNGLARGWSFVIVHDPAQHIERPAIGQVANAKIGQE